MFFFNGMMNVERILEESDGVIESEVEDEKIFSKRVEDDDEEQPLPVVDTEKLPVEELLNLSPWSIKGGAHKVALLAARRHAGLSIFDDGSVPPQTENPSAEVTTTITKPRAVKKEYPKKIVTNRPRRKKLSPQEAAIIEEQYTQPPTLPVPKELELSFLRARELGQLKT